jgi:hypothetical protein
MFGILTGFVRGIRQKRVAVSLQVDRIIFTKSSIIFTGARLIPATILNFASTC